MIWLGFSIAAIFLILFVIAITHYSGKAERIETELFEKHFESEKEKKSDK
jgi:hypothetical protein